MEVGTLVRYKAADFIGVVIETSYDRVRVHWPNRDDVWWIDQGLLEVLCE